jgi:hypothetical protein
MAVVTSEWGPPADTTGGHYEFILASQSLDRMRVRGTLLVGPGGVLSTIRFADNPDNAVINKGAYVPLGEALVDFWTR